MLFVGPLFLVTTTHRETGSVFFFLSFFFFLLSVHLLILIILHHHLYQTCINLFLFFCTGFFSLLFIALVMSVFCQTLRIYHGWHIIILSFYATVTLNEFLFSPFTSTSLFFLSFYFFHGFLR